MRRQSLFAALLLAIAVSTSHAALIGSPKILRPSVVGTPAGYTVYDLVIDFEGQLFGQQMVLELTSGSIYQDTFGGDTPPNSALLPIFPSLAADSFVTIGGFTSTTSSSVLVVGGSTELGKNGPKKFDTQGINIAWAPAPGVIINGGVDFPIARLTLSNDAVGSLYLFSNAGGVGTVVPAGRFPIPFPEPTTAALVGLGLLAAATRRRA